MNIDLLSLNVDVLSRLYKAKERELESAILSGTSWDLNRFNGSNFVQFHSENDNSLEVPG